MPSGVSGAIHIYELEPIMEPSPDKTGGLKGSMQHLLGVYPPEFEIPRFVVVGY